MKYKILNKVRIIALLLTISWLSSCVSPKEFIYFQSETENEDAKSDSISTSYEAVIQKGDILSVKISSLSPEASSFFNPYEDSFREIDVISEGYLVDANGTIELPVIGEIILENLTINQAKETIKNKLTTYLKNPTVRIRFKNFRISVLGEVARPSVYSIQNDKITLPEALGLAGDLTIYGNRKNVLIIREINGTREFARVNLKSRELFNSSYYYLRSNDIVYVEPNKARAANTDNFYRIAPLVISALTMISLVIYRLP